MHAGHREGNDHVSAGRFREAISSYTEAISSAPTAALFANRSFCHGKLGDQHAALVDAELAVSLDKLYVKGYYRKAKALYALQKYDESVEAAERGLAIGGGDNPDLKEILAESNERLVMADYVVTIDPMFVTWEQTQENVFLYIELCGRFAKNEIEINISENTVRVKAGRQVLDLRARNDFETTTYHIDYLFAGARADKDRKNDNIMVTLTKALKAKWEEGLTFQGQSYRTIEKLRQDYMTVWIKNSQGTDEEDREFDAVSRMSSKDFVEWRLGQLAKKKF